MEMNKASSISGNQAFSRKMEIFIENSQREYEFVERTPILKYDF
jgi:hypothetical protein